MSRAARMVTTRAGIQIGRAYVAPPQQLGAQAEVIQSALLSKRRPPLALTLAVLALQLVVAGAVRRVLDHDLVATYLRHRRMFFSRRESLLRALVVSFPIFR